MSLHEIKKTAFAKWLLLQSEQEAMLHLWQCLTSGPKDNMVWDLFTVVHGKHWKAEPEDLKPMLRKALSELRAA